MPRSIASSEVSSVSYFSSGFSRQRERKDGRALFHRGEDIAVRPYDVGSINPRNRTLGFTAKRLMNPPEPIEKQTKKGNGHNQQLTCVSPIRDVTETRQYWESRERSIQARRMADVQLAEEASIRNYRTHKQDQLINTKYHLDEQVRSRQERPANRVVDMVSGVNSLNVVPERLQEFECSHKRAIKPPAVDTAPHYQETLSKKKSNQCAAVNQLSSKVPIQYDQSSKRSVSAMTCGRLRNPVVSYRQPTPFDTTANPSYPPTNGLDNVKTCKKNFSSSTVSTHGSPADARGKSHNNVHNTSTEINGLLFGNERNKISRFSRKPPPNEKPKNSIDSKLVGGKCVRRSQSAMSTRPW